MMSRGGMRGLKSLDMYPKTLEECAKKTLSGGFLSVGVVCLIIYLAFSEFIDFVQLSEVHHLTVDTTMGGEIRVNFNVTFPRISCTMLSLDIMDITGQHHLEVDKISHDIQRRFLDINGRPVVDKDTGEEKGHEKMELGNTKVAAMKQSGEKEHNITLVTSEDYCGSCYGAGDPGQCCNTCDDVRMVYRKKNWALRPDAEVPNHNPDRNPDSNLKSTTNLS